MTTFVPRRGWSNRHLQTVRSRLAPARIELPDPELLLVPVSDGDKVAVLVNAGDPMVLLVHGMGGTAESEYIRYTAAGLLEAGFGVARVDLRGAGLSGEYSSGMYHAGRTSDLRAVIEAIGGRAAAMGFSLGGNAVIKLVGEQTPGVSAGVAVSAPLDLAVGAEHLHHRAGGLYEKFLVRRLKAEALRRGARFTPAQRQDVLAARTIIDFDNAITAPRHGWRDAAQYYEVNSSIRFLPQVRVPLLVIHAKDDPMVPAGPYEAFDWASVPTVELVLTQRGGHVGFHAACGPPLYVGAAVEFLSRQL